MGRAVAKQLSLGQHTVQIVSRGVRDGGQGPAVTLPGPGKLFSPDTIAGADCIINLAGENIAGSRWSAAARKEIMNSRIHSTASLADSILRNQKAGLPYPKVFISASATGYYGSHPKQEFTENSENGHGFLAGVCRSWENEAVRAESAGVRVVRLRFGHVLELDGGILAKVAVPFRFGAGGYPGSGQQWISWIHRKDLVAVILQAAGDSNWHGAYNACTPNAVTMREFMETLGRVLNRKSRIRIPAFVTRIFFGKMADEILLAGQKVYPERLLQQGYTFQYAFLPDALADIFKNQQS